MTEKEKIEKLYSNMKTCRVLINTPSSPPINILVDSGTLTPAISAIVCAFCPTIFAFRAPFIIIAFLTFSVSFSLTLN